jgi:DDE family transposase
MATVPQVATALQGVFTITANSAARRSGFIQRQRRLTGAAFVQGLVFGWLAHPSATYDQLVQAIARAGIRVSAQALEQRFTAAAAHCLQLVLEAAVTQIVSAEVGGQALLQRFTAVWLLDSTVVKLPRHFAQEWPGSGEAGVAAIKLHTALDLLTGRLRGPLVGAGRPQDKCSPLQHAPLEPGALRITDLGFYALAVLRDIGGAGAYWLCRAQVQTILFTADDVRWTLVELMAAQRGSIVDLPVTLGVTARLPARLVGFRLDGQTAARRRRKLRRDANRKRQPVSRARLALAHWDLIITNVPQDLLTPEEARLLLRARWQIELLFKRWKSDGALATSRSQRPERILCELYAKLLGQVILHWCCVLGAWRLPERSLVKAGRVVRDHACELARCLARPRRLCELLRALVSDLQVSCRMNTRKTKPNHAQLMHHAA